MPLAPAPGLVPVRPGLSSVAGTGVDPVTPRFSGGIVHGLPWNADQGVHANGPTAAHEPPVRQ